MAIYAHCFSLKCFVFERKRKQINQTRSAQGCLTSLKCTRTCRQQISKKHCNVTEAAATAKKCIIVEEHWALHCTCIAAIVVGIGVKHAIKQKTQTHEKKANKQRLTKPPEYLLY